MAHRLAFFSGALLGLLGIAPPIASQSSTPPSQPTSTAAAVSPAGTWVGVGAGGGWVRISCSICRLDRNLGPSGFLRFGTTLRPGLLLGAEGAGWLRTENEVRSHVLTGGIAVFIYPYADRGLFLKSGTSFVRYSVDDGAASSNLFGLLVGAGYDFPVGDGLAVTQYIQLAASSFGSYRTERATVANDISLSLLQIGIGLTRR